MYQDVLQLIKKADELAKCGSIIYLLKFNLDDPNIYLK